MASMGDVRQLCETTTGKGFYGDGNRWTASWSRRLWGAETGPNPTDRGKLGTKRHMLTDQRGAPLAVVITGANCVIRPGAGSWSAPVLGTTGFGNS